MNIINLKNITKRYGKETVLDKVDIAVKKGEIFGILGKNGAGKTTLVKIICTLLLPDEGKGTVMGFDLLKEDAEIRANVSLVAPTADVGVDPVLTVEENLLFWATVYGLRGKEKLKRVTEVLKILELYEVKDRWAMEISAGMRQKLGIGRAILVHHPLLLLDEPTVKLDIRSKFSLRKFIKDVRDKFGTTIIVTTHYFEEAEKICDRVMILNEGEVITVDTIQNLKLKFNPFERILIKVRDTSRIKDIKKYLPQYKIHISHNNIEFITPLFENAMETILRSFDTMNIEIEDITSYTPTLEEIFLQVTEGK